MKQITKEKYNELLNQRDALQKDIEMLNNTLMRAQTTVTANIVSNGLATLNNYAEDVLTELLSYVNLVDKDKVFRNEDVSKVNKKVLTLNKKEL